MRKEDSLIVQKIIRKVIDANNSNKEAKVVCRISRLGYNISEEDFVNPKVHFILNEKDFEVTQEGEWVGIYLVSSALDKSRLEVYNLKIEPGREWEKTNIGDTVENSFKMIDVHIDSQVKKCLLLSFNIITRSVKTSIPNRQSFATYGFLKNGKGDNIPVDDIQNIYTALVGYRWAEIDNPIYDALRHISGLIEVRYKKG